MVTHIIKQLYYICPPQSQFCGCFHAPFPTCDKEKIPGASRRLSRGRRLPRSCQTTSDCYSGGLYKWYQESLPPPGKGHRRQVKVRAKVPILVVHQHRHRHRHRWDVSNTVLSEAAHSYGVPRPAVGRTRRRRLVIGLEILKRLALPRPFQPVRVAVAQILFPPMDS